jgi:hypothetical protein
MLNATQIQRREKLVVAGLGILIRGATINAPSEWVPPHMSGTKQDPKQEFSVACEAVLFEARAKLHDTNKGGSPEWNADLRWLMKFQARIMDCAPPNMSSHQALGTWADLALELMNSEVLLPAKAEILHFREHLASVRLAFASVIRSDYKTAIMQECRKAELFAQETSNV